MGKRYAEWCGRARIRPVRAEDTDTVIAIFNKAREFMRSYGNAEQWGGAYPGLAEIEQDVRLGEGYICEIDGRSEAYFMFMRRDEPLYHRIDGETWLNDEPYGAIHRIASNGNYKGVSDYCIDWCKQFCSNLRGDTHHNNFPMQRVFERNGFTRRGTVYMEDGSPRIAYHFVKE